MAGTTLENKQVHSRSISLPTRLHPNSLKIVQELNKLKIGRQSSSSSLTTIPSEAAESIQARLIKLAGLHNSIAEFIQCPRIQQALHNQQHKNLIEKFLEISFDLLDACSNAKELMLDMKEQVQDLQSALRRRGGDSSVESNVRAYVSFRKESKKDIARCLRALNKAQSSIGSPNFINMGDVGHDQHLLPIVINVLRESSAITIFNFRSIFLFLAMPEMKTKAAGWSLIKKLITVAAATEKSKHEIFNEVGNVDLAMHSLHGKIRKSDTKADVKLALERLETLGLGIKGLETGLDCMLRRLIQNQVSLLNVLTP